MKKLAIAGASVVLAAMPVVGVFAADSNSFTDTLEVTVPGGCTLTNSLDTTPGTYTGDREFEAEIQPGNVKWLNTASQAATAAAATDQGQVAVACNTSDNTKTWTVNVTVNGLTGAVTSTTIGGGAQTSGANSGWAIKSNAQLGTTGSFTSDPFENYAAAATGVFLRATADKTATFNPSYQVYIAPGQAPDTYTGTAEYVITLPNS